MKIRLDGYSAKSDEVIKSTDSRYEQFRKYTNGYTGPKQSIRSRLVPFTKIKELTLHMKNFIHLPLEYYDVKLFNQFFRGVHFISTDYLLAQTHNTQ